MSKTIKNLTFNNSEKANNFRARLMAQLLVIFIALSLMALRIGVAVANKRLTSQVIQLIYTTLPFLGALCLIVIVKYILFKKSHNWVFKYANFIDFIFALLFAAEWVMALNTQLSQPIDKENFCYSLFAIVTLGSFSWRTLLQILISQLWQVRIIAPTAAWIFLIQFAVRHYPRSEVWILLYGIFQIVYVILIFYFEYKMNFTFTLGSVQQQQWLQLNEFILNNIPENIAIMDLDGDCKCISENFRKLMNRRTQADEVKEFLRNIRDLQKQVPDNESDSDESRRETFALQNHNSSSTSTSNGIRLDMQDPPSLDELITVFGGFVRKDLIKERLPYSFNAKFKAEDETGEIIEERSIQIHISFINYQPYKYILLILRDTTQRDIVLKLQGDMKYKDHLLASVSHELRTPLNGNINMIEAALRSKDISEKIKETLLLPAVKSSKFLLYLVNDILDLYQIKAQKLRLVFQQSNLKETLTNTLQLIELHAKKKGIELQTNIDPTIPDNFCTDHARFSQIILNLINNSIKFTQSGYVKLSAWLLTDADQIKISVEDSGIGMTQTDIGKLFKDFTHIDSKDRQNINPTGVGLGLKIANDMAKLLGPTGNTGIRVDSAIEKGSIFSFVIENKESGLESQRNARPQEEHKEDPSPLIPNEFNIGTEISLQIKIEKVNSLPFLPRLMSEVPSQPTLSTCSCARILVVDDDPFNIMAYEVILYSLGAKYETAYNGRSAIDKMLNKVRYPCCLNCHPYKIIFMDEEMPGMNGRDAVVEIRSLQNQGLLPQMEIMGCTAHQAKEKIDEFLKAGITEYVSKPISFDTIQRILDKYDV